MKRLSAILLVAVVTLVGALVSAVTPEEAIEKLREQTRNAIVSNLDELRAFEETEDYPDGPSHSGYAYDIRPYEKVRDAWERSRTPEWRMKASEAEQNYEKAKAVSNKDEAAFGELLSSQISELGNDKAYLNLLGDFLHEIGYVRTRDDSPSLGRSESELVSIINRTLTRSGLVIRPGSRVYRQTACSGFIDAITGRMVLPLAIR